MIITDKILIDDCFLELFVESVTREKRLPELANTFATNAMPSSKKLTSSSGEIPSIHTTLTAEDAGESTTLNDLFEVDFSEWSLQTMQGRSVETFIVSVVTTLWESLFVVHAIVLLRKELSTLLENNGMWRSVSLGFIILLNHLF